MDWKNVPPQNVDIVCFNGNKRTSVMRQYENKNSRTYFCGGQERGNVQRWCRRIDAASDRRELDSGIRYKARRDTVILFK